MNITLLAAGWRDYPALVFYDAPRLGKCVNYLSHKIFEQTLWQTSKAAIRAFWKKQYGGKPKDFISPFAKQHSARRPTIVSCSNYVFPKPSDWPDHVYNTGYRFLDESDDWTAPQDLAEFLQGPAPLYIGFGSMGGASHAEKTTKIVIDALEQTNQRGILATGWGGLSQVGQAYKNIFVLKNAPHAWLFPKMAAVIHHGGAGTTAAGLRAGVPNVVIPHALDQFAWARRVYELGVGPKPIRKRHLSAERLKAAIEQALSEDIKAKAKALGQKIESERGVDTAVQIITDLL